MAEKRKEVRYIAEKFANAILADASSYIISTDGLQALNAFLDELLFILIDNAKGLETNRIKAAVYQTFPTPLGKNAIVEAELEAKSYIDMGGKDTSNHMGNSGPSSSTSAIFNADSDESRVEQVFEQFRAKCQYYSKLGERLGSPAGCPNNSVIVPTLIAIYVTAVLEHVAEYVLQAASTIADRQDHADKVTVREVYVALLEDRQIEHTFEIMILKSQLQRRFRNSLIMPGSNVRPEEPATVKRSGSWGKQLRLGNADKPKLDVQLPTDFEDDDIPIDPNRPQFADWDVPPDEESKLKKKNDFEMLFSSGETMKVSLTPNRLRTIEVHRKAGGVGGNVATRSSSRAASVLGGRTHGRRPSNGTPAANNNVAARKNSYAATLVDGQAPLPSPPQQEPSVPSIPSNFGSSPPASRRQEQLSTNANNPPLSPMQQQQLRQQQQQQQSSEAAGYGVISNKKQPQPPAELKMERASTSTMESQLTLSTAGTSNMTPISPVNSMTFNSQNGPNRLASPSVKTTAQATSDLVSLLGRTPSQASSFSQQPQAQQSSESLASSASMAEAASGKKENPIKNFMGRLGRNSLHRLSTDNSSSASSPTSIRSFNVSGGTTGQQGPGSGTGSASNSTNGSIYSGHSGQTSLATAAAASSPAHHAERQGSGMSNNDVVTQQQQQFYQPPPQQQSQPSSMQSGSRVLAQESHSNFALVSGFPIPQENGNANARAPVTNSKTAGDSENSSDHSTSKMASVPAPVNTSGVPSSPKTASPEQHASSRPMSPEAGGFPIPSRGTSLSHDVTSPTATNYPSSYEAVRQGTEPRPLSPRTQSPRSSSPMSSSPRSHSPLQASPTQYPYNRSNSTAEGGILSPSPLSNTVSANTSPSSSSLSLIAYGKVQHIQDKLSKTAQTPAHGFKPQEHLQNLPTRISLEGTIRANPFYQQDRNSSARSSSSLVGHTGYSAETSTAQYTKSSSPAPESPDHGSCSTPAVTPNAHGGSNSSGSESGDDREEDEERRHASRDGMVSPATSPEMGAQKDRLPSATTRTLTAAAAAATALTAKQQQLSTTPPNSGSRLQSKASEAESLRSLASQRSRDMSANVDQKSTTHEQRHQEEDEEDVPYVAPVLRARVSSNRQSNRQSVRQSIFVDEAAQAMDALSRARHRQSMRLENGADLEDEDDDDDEDYMNQNIQPPEKWHYSDLEDETSEAKDSEDSEEEEEEEEEDMEYEYEEQYAMDGERRKKHESFMSAKSHLMHNGSTASLLDAYTDHHDENGDEDDQTVRAGVKDQHVRALEVQEPTTKSDQNSTTNEFDTLVPVVDSEEDEDRNGEDEDESEDSEDLEDNDDEEGQDRRIYLQHLRAQKREARRLERLASGETEETMKKGRGKNGSRRVRKVSSLDSTGAASTETTTGDTKKKGLRKGHSKENLRAQQKQQQGRPQTPTTPVPTTQVIPLTPTDLVLIRQKLFAAGNFEASMRMLDTIFHAAMAKMVEGRERGVQTEPMAFQDNESEATVPAAAATALAALPSKEPKKSVPTSSTSTSTTEDSDQPQKQLQWVAVKANEPKAVAAVADDDDEDRVVEWLLGGV
ncbi:hypothetical protein KVV02_003718 [Mortierella alpina]|uniref:Uncharacterized protein n=1 Tax=Mortierella alpina TaxID=64518 RepID=A0A9P8AC25_MORAP|nr:hypothetical protein KVV02_003718 [Mortierella alpina]